jgi:spoIIIJ-associated protein
VESIEASGKNVEEAIQQGLIRLGKHRDEVEVTVLQEPSRGIVGLGSREARVRLTALTSSPTAPAPSTVSGAVITPEMADAIFGPEGPDVPIEEGELYAEEEGEFDDEEEYVEDEEGEFEGVEEILPPLGTPTLVSPQASVDTAAVDTAQGDMQEVESPTREDIEITVDILQHILRYMNIRATVQVRSTNPLTLNIQGINENLGLLIGRRGETLAALQLLVRELS